MDLEKADIFCELIKKIHNIHFQDPETYVAKIYLQKISIIFYYTNVCFYFKNLRIFEYLPDHDLFISCDKYTGRTEEKISLETFLNQILEYICESDIIKLQEDIIKYI